MNNHKLPPQEKLRQLEPYLYISTGAIVVMSILGGWAGAAWPWVLGIYLVRVPVNLFLSISKIRGVDPVMITIVSAVINYAATVATVLLAGGSPNPFWLLFLVETLAAAMYRTIQGVIAYSISALLVLAYFQILRGFDQTGFLTGCIYTSLALMTGLTTCRALDFLYAEHENREKVEIEVFHTERRLQQITKHMLDLIAQMDVNGILYYTSPSFQTVLGYTPYELEGRSIVEIVHAQDGLDMVRACAQSFATALPVQLEVRLRHSQGHYLWFECIGKPSINSDLLDGVIFSGREITGRKQIEARVHASLQEKEALLKEIHHRVKNNLQIISSLLSLQAQNLKDPDAQNAFRMSQDRVRSMALIHEKLYQSENLAEIEFGQYIHNLATFLIRSYRAYPDQISLSIQCEPIFLDINTSIPCGLILNELISNSLKHAFPEKRMGEIRVEMRKGENHQVSMIVADNGVGLSPGLDPLNSPSLGLQLVNTLVNQLDGRLQFENNSGVRVEIIFERRTPGSGQMP